MPIKLAGKDRVVVCINHQLADHKPRPPNFQERTTMGVDAATWNAVTVVIPPSVPGGPRFDPSAGVPVKAFVCRVCGYVELYSAFATDPAVWGRR